MDVVLSDRMVRRLDGGESAPGIGLDAAVWPELEHPDDPVALWALRCTFLATLARLAPAALGELARAVEGAPAWLPGAPPPQVVAAVGAWATRHDLEADWIREAAIGTALAWRRTGVPARPTFEPLPMPSQRAASAPGTLRAGDPLTETREQARERFEARWGADVAELEGRGFERTDRHIRNLRGRRPHDGGPWLEQHLEWLVRYQVLGESKQAIADTAKTRRTPEGARVFGFELDEKERRVEIREGVYHSAVRKALEKTSRLLGLPLRQP